MPAMIPWLLLLAGAVSLLVGLRPMQRNRHTTWTQVPGTITQSDVDYDGELYQPLIRYEYSFNSRRYAGSTVRPWLLQYNWSGPAKRMCRRYPVGMQVPVYVDPNRPEAGVLETCEDRAGRMVIYSTSALLILGGLLLL
jgi:hypothetical protein